MKRLIALTAVALLVPAAGAAARPAAEKPKPLDGNAVIGFNGVGQIELGMTIAEARKAARRGIVGGSEVTTGCRHDTVLPRRFGLSTLRFKGKIRVLYVTRTAMPTAKGIRVNDSLDRLRSKYGSKLQERASDVSLETRIFELHGKGTREMQFSVNAQDKIFQIATGLRPEVDFSEGCA
ncbi:MAG TPA: hypothetical protein VFX80_08845 [Solirubrobacteraceae bacterium]|nr:hypothetical protein [Solirubrobacteraceae bacterium]